MGDGLDLALVEREGGLEQCFAVARGAGARDARPMGQNLAQRVNRLHGGFDGVALVVRVERPQKLALFADQRELRRGRARVEAEEAIALIGCKLAARHDGLVMARAEGGKVGFILKERRQAL